jgi:MOSC domain-containing protein YiiM
VVSIQVGLPRLHGDPAAANRLGRPWRSGFYKDPVTGPVWLGRTNLAGDGQADLKHHGGTDKAVLSYAAAHYPLWRAELHEPDLPYGGFGENFTVGGLSEESVCVGDVFEIGAALVQVSQPRQPCRNIARRWQRINLPTLVDRTGRTGWYLRVLREGEVEAGQQVMLAARPNPAWTVARATRALRGHQHDRHEARALAGLPELSAAWKETLAAILDEAA